MLLGSSDGRVGGERVGGRACTTKRHIQKACVPAVDVLQTVI